MSRQADVYVHLDTRLSRTSLTESAVRQAILLSSVGSPVVLLHHLRCAQPQGESPWSRPSHRRSGVP